MRKFVDLDEATLSEAIHLYTKDGQLLRGVDFVRYLTGEVGWMIPARLLLRIKILKPLFEKIYEFIANRRRRISTVSGLQSRALYE